MLRVDWSVDPGPGGRGLTGEATIEVGARLVVARRMALPREQPIQVESLAGSTYLFLRVPYVSDPALVVTSTDGHPVLHRGQRANGAIVELRSPTGDSTTPAPEQRVSVTVPDSVVELRFPELTVSVRLGFDPVEVVTRGTGTIQLGVDALQDQDTWLVAALAVALSPDNGVVSHARLKEAFAAWRGEPEHSVGSFDRNILRPALESRGIAEPGARVNKIALLVDRCRRTFEFPPRILEQVRDRMS